MSRFHLVLLLHAHQPVGNFDDVFERAYAKCYLPFLDPLERHPNIHVGLHLSGPLWEWIAARHEEYFTRMASLVARGQVELVGGGFYEPILVSIPPDDRREQIVRMERFLESRFGKRPEGAWLTERVWEPHLAGTLGRAGVGYTLVDDNHFLLGGFEADQLFGYYRVEDLDASVDILPGLESLRYAIPFRPVEETIEFLRQSSDRHPGGMAAMGDDLEKFGIWPGTYDHCYTNGWLEQLFQALEANLDWLAVSTPAEYRRDHAPLGRAALPTASYSEMMEWALPLRARERVQELSREFADRPEILRSVRHGVWRNFLVKYPEADLLSRKMQFVSRRIAKRSRSRPRGAASRTGQGRTHVLRAQCNDAYWHGIFGGLYSPHLREAISRELIAAERAIDGERPAARAQREGFSGPARNETYFTGRHYNALVDSADGATLALLDFRPRHLALMNTIARRPEAYHSRITQAAEGDGGVASIHDRVRVKERGLERLLRYDRWLRRSFRLLVFPSGKRPDDYAALELGEAPAPAAAPYQADKISASAADFAAEVSLAPVAGADVRARAEKQFRFRSLPDGFSLIGTARMALLEGGGAAASAGLELVLNLMAPASPDRYFAFGGERHPLGWQGVAPGPELNLVDEWQKVAAKLIAPGAAEFWIAPIETVSESEDGFERVYQGSQILAVWPLALEPGKAPWEAEVELQVTGL
ncbi:MAG TPA: alpha-amylase/4-alpha-glucanotransferase domain-containing protein [Candidatus Dormibacteraeota bacterium]|nr:alpha-amylase/4-alpha-glucanotransferase domain-containing protein [Candidatus Dormibacteraeota bacterium]